MSGIPWLDPDDDDEMFPSPEYALREPDGLLAVGGSLSPKRLLAAYCQGIFPWYSADQPILWWSPDPRTVLVPSRIKVSRSLRKTLSRKTFTVTADTMFDTVIDQCGAPRQGESGTWITADVRTAYCQLHRLGYAHSIETWQDNTLVGGLYGVAIGRIFYGESMFSRVSDASKTALVTLAQQLERWQFSLIDCQMHTDHLVSMGAEEIPRSRFTAILARDTDLPGHIGHWRLDPDLPYPRRITGT